MTKPIARDPIYRGRGFDAEIIELWVLVHLGASDTIVVGRSSGAHDDEADRA
jgi:hypothetical protein